MGDVFGAPLAMEGLLVFFFESTFPGLWIFGWSKLSPRTHLPTLSLALIGSLLSPFFIIVANSWMQHPVLNNIWAILTNNTAGSDRRVVVGPYATIAGRDATDHWVCLGQVVPRRILQRGATPTQPTSLGSTPSRA